MSFRFRDVRPEYRLLIDFDLPDNIDL
jgi:hypothetical protein